MQHFFEAGIDPIETQRFADRVRGPLRERRPRRVPAQTLGQPVRDVVVRVPDPTQSVEIVRKTADVLDCIRVDGNFGAEFHFLPASFFPAA